jgi:hypothetical protein
MGSTAHPAGAVHSVVAGYDAAASSAAAVAAAAGGAATHATGAGAGGAAAGGIRTSARARRSQVKSSRPEADGAAGGDAR